MLEKYQNYIVAVILLIVLAISIGTALGDAAIMDEVAHIPAGYSYVKYQDFRLNPEHPPLLKDLAGIPLQFLDLTFPVEEKFWTTAANGQWEAGWRFIYPAESREAGAPPAQFNGVNLPMDKTEAILFFSRFPIILLSLALGFVIFRWAKELFGPKAGLLALALYAFDPNILGHNHYVTTDLGIAAFSVFSFYFFIKYLKNPGWKTIILAGIFLGLAQLAKYSAVLLFPIFGLVLVLYALCRKEKVGFSFLGSGRIKRFWLQKIYLYIATFIVVLAVHGLLIGLVYELNILQMPAEKVHQLIDTQLYGGSQNIVSPYLHAMADSSVLRPYAQYLTGFFMVFGRVAGGNTTFFFGEVTNQSFRAYFPLVFLIKEPLPILILLFFSIAVGIVMVLKSFSSARGEMSRSDRGVGAKKIWTNLKNYLGNHPAEFSMLAFIVLYVYVSITGNLNIGLRHLFPIFPFMYILIAKEVVVFGNRIGSFSSAQGEMSRSDRGVGAKKLFWVIVLLLVAWLAAESAAAYPYYLAYFNQTVGGTKNGYRYVTDSNVDWGQELKRLKIFVEENNIQKIRVDYFGGGDVKHYLGDKAVLWHSDAGQEPGWYAISATFLQNSLYYKITEGKTDYEWLRERIPYANIGGSILIYEVD